MEYNTRVFENSHCSSSGYKKQENHFIEEGITDEHVHEGLLF